MASTNATALPMRVIDLADKTFGKWTVVRFIGISKRKAMWLCRCECGKESLVSGTALNCHHSEKCSSCARRRHGMRNRPEYCAWSSMLQRCRNRASHEFFRYGGRGIAVCQRWQDSFEAFYADMGPRPSDRHSIERKENDGDYNPGNCIWAVPTEQARNRRSNRLLTFNGETMCLAEWAERYQLRRDTLRERIRRGWSIERALTTPVS